MTTPNLQASGQEGFLSEAITERRATPSFDGSPIPDNVLSAILRAGLESPSGYNLQPWRFVVVRSAEQKRRLRVKKPVRLLSVVAIRMLLAAPIWTKSWQKRPNMALAKSKIEKLERL